MANKARRRKKIKKKVGGNIKYVIQIKKNQIVSPLKTLIPNSKSAASLQQLNKNKTGPPTPQDNKLSNSISAGCNF